MKRFISLIAILILSGITLFSQESIARIYFYRPLLTGSAFAIKISVDGKNIGNLKIGDRLIYETKNFRERKLSFQMSNIKNEILADIKPGSENYVMLDLGMTNLNCRLIDPVVGKNDFNNLKKFKKNSKPLLFADSDAPVDLPVVAEEKNNITASQVQPVKEVPVEKPPVQKNITTSKVQPVKEVPVKKPPVQKDSLRKLALVIGNSDYKYGAYLRNPTNDAQDMSMTLKNLGFDVMFYTDQDLNSLKKAIDQFGLKLSKYDIGLFYYAGHGIQSKGYNYFIPVDANLQAEAQVEFDCVNSDRLLSLMEDAGNSTNIIILDACRDNPFERSWRRSTTGSGLAFMNAPSGSLIAYSTSPGRTASDGSGRNGLYTASLLKYLREPNVTIEEMFKKVREDVSKKSAKQQVPWESTSLVGSFYFSVKEE
jgi:hypothetical protein